MHKTVLLVLLLSLGLTGLVACNSQPVDLETAKELALKKARRHRDIDFKPFAASQAYFEDPDAPEQYFLHQDFTDYHFVYVWSEWGHEENSPFAVSKDGSVFKLPEEFNRLTKHRGLMLEHADDARTLLEFYLLLP